MGHFHVQVQQYENVTGNVKQKERVNDKMY